MKLRIEIGTFLDLSNVSVEIEDLFIVLAFEKHGRLRSVSV